MITNDVHHARTPSHKSPLARFKKRMVLPVNPDRRVYTLAHGSGNMPPWVGMNFDAYWVRQRGGDSDERVAHMLDFELPAGLTPEEQKRFTLWLAEGWTNRRAYQYVILVEQEPQLPARSYACFLVEAAPVPRARH